MKKSIALLSVFISALVSMTFMSCLSSEGSSQTQSDPATSKSKNLFLTQIKQVKSMDITTGEIQSYDIDAYCEDGFAIKDTFLTTDYIKLMGGLMVSYDSNDLGCVPAAKGSSSIPGSWKMIIPQQGIDWKTGESCTIEDPIYRLNDPVMGIYILSSELTVNAQEFKAVSEIDGQRFCMAEVMVQSLKYEDPSLVTKKVDCQNIEIQMPQSKDPLKYKMEHLNQDFQHIKMTMSLGSKSCAYEENPSINPDLITDAYCATQTQVPNASTCIQQLFGALAQGKKVSQSLVRSVHSAF
jgi:hypothetical protein